MGKTDKELTTEIVIAYLNAWSGPNKVPTKQEDMPDLIQGIYDVVRNLETNE